MRRPLTCLALVALASCPAEEPRAPSPPPPEVREAPTVPPVLEPGATVRAHRGRVEVLGPSSAWGPASVGQRLGQNAVIRTAEDGSVELSVDEVTLRVHEASELRVAEVGTSTVRAELRGRLESQVPEGRGTVEIEASGTGSVARSTGGHFFMMSTGQRVVTVASVEGEVTLETPRGSIRVPPGRQSTTRRDGRPTKSLPPLEKVLLSVKWPATRETNRRLLQLSGRVGGGARVFVEGKLTATDGSGRFERQLQLQPGRQEVSVTAIDVRGRTVDDSRVLLMDDRKPPLRLKKVPLQPP